LTDTVVRSNRLAKEKSPYLLQHAHNPVDWYPWSEEAFEKAMKEDKPIFLSIGYSTCHWCHVMEKESFEDLEVAELLNRKFVSIKVDREERPDIDNIYMKACMLIAGRGGWPLTIVATPQKEPFFAGTYLPRNSRAGIIGLIDLLRNIEELWKNDRSKLVSTAERVTEHLTRQIKANQHEEELTDLVLDEAFIRLLDSYDRVNAGFGISPKFPSPHNFLFLLRYWKRKGKRQALEMVEKTLQKMRLGGIFDQIGFGFHRYSTDSRWLVPHFEKMLYDQAMMLIAYIEAYQVTGKKEYRKTAEEIMEYVLRDMKIPEGGFLSAEDADSEGEEGKFYLWTEKEIKNAIGKNADITVKVFNVSEGGNFYDELHHTKTGKNILHLKRPLRQLSLELGMGSKELQENLRITRLKLFEVRDKRIHPLKDDKILTDWNGLMITALAKAAQAFTSIRYAKAAEKAVHFILGKIQRTDGGLFHRYRDGEASVEANLNDYAFMVWGLIDLYEATFKTKFLEKALRLQNHVNEHFWDKEDGGFFFTSDNSEKLFVRSKEFRDGATPSGSSIALLNLIRLARMTGNTQFEEKAEALVKAFSSHEGSDPSQNTMFLTALDFFIGPAYEIAVVGNPSTQQTKKMLQIIRTRFTPNKVILLKKEDDPTLQRIASYTRNMKMIEDKPTVYICQNFTCKKPMTNTKDVIKMLD